MSCTYDVANNTRMEFTGILTDQDGNPIPEIYLYLEGRDYTGGFLSNERSENLGENHTDNLGNFRVVSLKTSTNIFHINRSESSHFHYDEDTHEVHSEPTNSIFTSVDYVNVPGSMDLGTVKLHKRANLNFKITKSSISTDTLFWKLSYTHASCYFVFENGNLLEEESSCHEIFSDEYRQSQPPVDPNFENTYQTILGGSAEFTYQINQDGPQQTLILNIDETEQTYVFEY